LEPDAVGVSITDTAAEDDVDAATTGPVEDAIKRAPSSSTISVVIAPPGGGAASTIVTYSRLVVLPPTKAEIIGCSVAFLGMTVLVLLSQQNSSDESGGGASSASSTIRPFSVEGDLAALFAAVFMAINLLIGSKLRSWMPLWLYSFPSFGASAVFSGVLSFASGDATSLFGATTTSIFGWLTDSSLFLLTFAIAFVPTIMGHTVSNLALARVSPVALSTMLLMVPPIGSVYGYILGLQGKPGKGLLIGGPIILIGIGIVVILGKRKKR
jgi:drug/metabolite transporter (DMT)-like permease